MELEYSIELDDWREKVRKNIQDIDRRAKLVGEVIALEIVNHATSNTGGTVPGAPVNSAGNYVPVDERTPRKAHPGGWADITSALAESISESIRTDGFGVEIIVEATMEYAEALDAKTGYDVLGGAEVVARKAIAKHAHKLFD